jgi:hypothetical protein
MRGVVRCDHCGAPHRRDAASTRFRCDWCGGDNRVEAVRLVEELLLAADDRTRDPATRVREALGSRGLRAATVHSRAQRWAALWQVVNEHGEEFLAPVSSTTATEPALRSLPAGPLRLLDDDPPSWTTGLDPRPAIDQDADTVVKAAQASFDDADSAVVLVRLVWIGVAEFKVSYRGQTFGALQVLGTDRVIFETLPDARTSEALIPERLATFAAFIVGAILLGVVVDEAGPRLALEASWLALGTLFWFIRRDRGLGGAR